MLNSTKREKLIMPRREKGHFLPSTKREITGVVVVLIPKKRVWRDYGERESFVNCYVWREREIFGQGRYRHKVECVGPPTYFWFFTKMPLCSFLLQMNMAKLVFIFCIQNTFLGTKNQNWVQVTKPNKFFSGRSHKKLQWIYNTHIFSPNQTPSNILIPPTTILDAITIIFNVRSGICTLLRRIGCRQWNWGCN